MPAPRYRQVSLEATPYYHCISRCVRRAFLCGADPLSGYNFEHRRQWIVDRLKLLSSVFAIDVCAYAIMHNHYHIVLRIDERRARRWSDDAMMRRWLQLFPGTRLARQGLSPASLNAAEQHMLQEHIATWRARLCDLSWFMRCLNEPIARLANAEDQCTGRFWEGRFKSQALLDERALLACMAYVDLNPIRAGLARTPEASDYTSIRERIREPADTTLLPFNDRGDDGLPFALPDYLELVDWAGRQVQDHKRGHIPSTAPPILNRLQMEAAPVMDYLAREQLPTFSALGPVSRLRVFATAVGRRFIKGHSFARQLCPEGIE